MPHQFLLQIVPVLLLMIAARLPASETAASLLGELDGATRSEEPAVSVGLLRKIANEEEIDVFSFGRGLGPNTVQRQLFHAIPILWPKLSRATLVPLSKTDPEWLRISLSQTVEEGEIVKHLNSSDPLVRLVALLKLSQDQTFSDLVQQKLIEIAKHDQFYKIVRRSLPSPDGGPPLLENEEQVVEATLRGMAAKVLATCGILIPEASLAPTDEEGAVWISGLKDLPGMTVTDISFAIELATPYGPKMVALKEAALAKDTHRLMGLMHEYLDKKETSLAKGDTMPPIGEDATARMSSKRDEDSSSKRWGIVVALVILTVGLPWLLKRRS